jgi:adenosylcobinamide kinase/adenosylcobinamide-phosphate guanylyltransferase
MEIQLLGTGSADGWPNPFCSCASCSWAREAGEIRGQTGALVDGLILIDCGPEIPRAAERHHARLDRVHTLAFTHAHPDHLGPIALLIRQWAGRSEPLTVVGPPAVVAACQPWIAPTDRIEFVVAEVGRRVVVNGYTYTPMAATHEGADIGPAVLYAIEGPDQETLLYACDTGPLTSTTLSAMANFRFDVVLLEETLGDTTAHQTDHLDLRTFPQALAALRGVTAIDDNTDVVAVHLSHHNPPGARLSARLEAWGARVVSDGEFLRQPPRSNSN